jgi:hypothetical protein
VAFETVDTDVLAPMPYLDGEIDLGKVSLAASASLMSADLGDANGRYWDVDALIKVQPGGQFELIAGMSYLLVDAHGRAGGRDFDTDFDVFGWFVGGGWSF